MWKKDAGEEGSTVFGSAPSPSNMPPRPGGSRSVKEPATIGPSITIKGDVTGDEDLIVRGRVDGKVELAQHNVTVGAEGKVKADIIGRTVTVEGEVHGDLRAQEQVVLKRSARVQGNISAPRVALEDGATFRGGIEMNGNAIGATVGAAPEARKPGFGGSPTPSAPKETTSSPKEKEKEKEKEEETADAASPAKEGAK